MCKKRGFSVSCFILLQKLYFTNLISLAMVNTSKIDLFSLVGH